MNRLDFSSRAEDRLERRQVEERRDRRGGRRDGRRDGRGEGRGIESPRKVRNGDYLWHHQNHLVQFSLLHVVS